jgi:hypothetical protein
MVMAVVYFCLLVLIGAFFLVNLVLAVIMEAFSKTDNSETEIKIVMALEEIIEEDKRIKISLMNLLKAGMSIKDGMRLMRGKT